MDGRSKRGLGPVVIAAASVALAIGSAVHQLATPVDVSIGWAFRGFIIVIALPYALVGYAIRFRAPENKIGKLLQTMGVLFVVAGVLEEYALRGLVGSPGSLPGAIYAAWVLQWAWIVIFGLSMFLFLLFPNGRYASVRWMRFRYYAAASIVVSTAGVAFAPGILDSFTLRPAFPNPLATSAIDSEVGEMIILFWLIGLGASAASLFIRYRKATGIERQQLKWLATGALFAALTFFLAGATETFFASAALGEFLTTLGIFLLPTAIGISILRYRLYDIDVVINRTLVYGLLTAILAAAYIGLVFAFQALLSPFTAESDLAIAASTLGVAGLFRPARSRVQDFIDRRFYRRKFDAERTVAEFSVRLRNEVELSAVTSELTSVVLQTMQPAHVSLWMRPVDG